MCFYYDDSETVEFGRIAIVKCRKPHKCTECKGEIRAGELAEHLSGKFDGEMFSDYYCGACELTRKHIAEHEEKEGCTGDEIWCPKGELVSYCNEHKFPRAGAEAGQEYLATNKADKAERLAAVK